MTATLTVPSLVLVALFALMVVALLKPEWFQ